MKVNSLFVGLIFLAASFTPNISHAAYKRICRGGDLPALRIELKKQIKDKLIAANIPFKFVNVVFVNQKRSTDVYAPDFSPNIVISSGPIPQVTFDGSFDTKPDCTITTKVKISVKYENGLSISKSDVSIPGELLFKAKVNSNGDLSGSPGAD